ncbi:MAG: hypothetical protein KAJ48_00015, partial [Elusimicrobiales bacterium]|nr:hypothetical protein [Elusimicrobiales bacterium]
MKKNRIQNNNIKEDNKIFLGKTSTIIILLVNIVLACFAILSYKSVGNQFSLSNRPFIGFENNGDKASQIIESIVYDNTPDIGVEFNSEDVGSGIILNLTLKNYGVLPAYFKMQPYSLIGDIQPFEENIDF